MSFTVDPGIKYHVLSEDYAESKVCYCFFHAVQRVVKGERIESEVYDTDDEYAGPSVCEDCLAEERESGL